MSISILVGRNISSPPPTGKIAPSHDAVAPALRQARKSLRQRGIRYHLLDKCGYFMIIQCVNVKISILFVLYTAIIYMI